MLQRKLRRLARTLAISAIATAGVTLAGTKPNANDLLQSHDLEFSMGISDWWLIQVTGGFDQPLGENLQSSDVEIESEFALLKREGDGIALSFQAGYEQAINHGVQVDGNPNEFGFGPIVELAKGPFLLTLNPLFTKQIGTFADQEGLGFEYGWRGEYDFTKHWGFGVEMFGEIEDLANRCPFNSQVHSIAPPCSTISAGMKTRPKAVTKVAAKLKPARTTTAR